jgi:anaerobic selenocysteine-containing dehydrogenase
MTALDGILSGKPYALRAMLLAGANPVLTNPNSEKVVEALSALELFRTRPLHDGDRRARRLRPPGRLLP